MSERVYRLGRGPWRHKCVGFRGCQPARLPRFQPDDEVLRREMRWPLVFMVVFHCPWVWKVRTEVSERVYRLGNWKGSMAPYKCVGFGVSQAAEDCPDFSRTMRCCGPVPAPGHFSQSKFKIAQALPYRTFHRASFLHGEIDDADRHQC